MKTQCERQVWDNGDQTSCDRHAVIEVPIRPEVEQAELVGGARCRPCCKRDLPLERKRLARLEEATRKQRALVLALETGSKSS